MKAEATPLMRRGNDNGAPSIVSQGVKIKGDIDSPGEFQLDGIVEGDISCGALSLGESGSVSGKIVAEAITVRGKVNGELCGNTVRVEKSAVVNGDITHQTLSVEAGARISGHLIHKDKPLDRAEAATLPPPEPATEKKVEKPGNGKAQAIEPKAVAG